MAQGTVRAQRNQIRLSSKRASCFAFLPVALLCAAATLGQKVEVGSSPPILAGGLGEMLSPTQYGPIDSGTFLHAPPEGRQRALHVRAGQCVRP
jgi:hypothetical protein